MSRMAISSSRLRLLFQKAATTFPNQRMNDSLKTLHGLWIVQNEGGETVSIDNSTGCGARKRSFNLHGGGAVVNVMHDAIGIINGYAFGAKHVRRG